MIVDVRLTVADVEHESPKLEARSSKEKMLEARSWKLEGRKRLEARSWKEEVRRKKLEGKNARSPKLEGRSGDAENQRAGKRVALKHIKNQEMAFRFFGNF